MTEDITDLRDDIFEGAVASPEDYAEPAGFKPLDEGKYLFKINKVDIDKDENGVLRNPKTPTIVLQELEVVNGEKVGRKVMFIRVRSNTYERKPGVKASELGDLLRALDRTFDMAGSITRAYDYLQECRDKGETFLARIRWEAFDGDHWRNNDGSNLDKDAQKALAKECRLTGQNKFAADGTWVGPSGATIEARAAVAQYLSSDKKNG